MSSNLFLCRELWSICVYQIKSFDDIFNPHNFYPFFHVGETGLRKDYTYKTTVADPFLFAYNGCLFLFYEAKTDHWHGEIWAKVMDHNMNWKSIGKVLSDSFHLSYPQVFLFDKKVYMIPESAQAAKVFLYQAIKFPTEWKKCAVLINAPMRDPTLFIRPEGFYLLCTDVNDYLRVYFSDKLHETFCACDYTITKNNSLSRNAGNIFLDEGSCYRISQDCSRKYGESISIHRILRLDKNGYMEHTVRSGLFKQKPIWCNIGYHHLTVEKYGNSFYAAIDGRCYDRYINTLSLAWLKLFAKFTNKNRIQCDA